MCINILRTVLDPFYQSNKKNKNKIKIHGRVQALIPEQESCLDGEELISGTSNDAFSNMATNHAVFPSQSNNILLKDNQLNQ